MLSRFLTRKEQLLLVGVGAAICLGGVVLYLHDQKRPASEASGPVGSVSAENKTDRAEVTEPVGVLTLDTIQSPELIFREDVSVRVSVAGAVRAPGVYEFDREARVKDLVESAGGVTPEADLSDINLAAKLIDGSTLAVPIAGQTIKDGNKLVLRKSESAAALNPPEYTISGWRTSVNRPVADGETRPGHTEAAAETTSPLDGLIDINHVSQQELETLPGIGPITAQEIIRYRSRTPFQTVDELDSVPGIGPKKLEAIRPLVTVTPG